MVYVGLPLAHACANKGFDVVGFDINKDRVKELNNGVDRTIELHEVQLGEIKNHIIYTT